MTVAVRVARPDDYAAIARISVDAYDASGQLGAGSAGAYRRTLADVAGRAAAGTLLAAVDEPSGAVLGTVLFLRAGSSYADMARGDEAEFRILAVDPAAQGRGVGRALVGECLRLAGAARCTEMVICYRDFVTVAYRLYSGLGFVRSPRDDWSPRPGVQLLGMRRPLD